MRITPINYAVSGKTTPRVLRFSKPSLFAIFSPTSNSVRPLASVNPFLHTSWFNWLIAWPARVDLSAGKMLVSHRTASSSAALSRGSSSRVRPSTAAGTRSSRAQQKEHRLVARAAEEEEQQQPEVEAEEVPEQAIATEEFEFSLSEAKKVIGNAGMGLGQVVNVDQQRGSSSRQQRAGGAIGAAASTVRCTITDLDASFRNWSIGRGCWQAAWGILAVCCSSGGQQGTAGLQRQHRPLDPCRDCTHLYVYHSIPCRQHSKLCYT